MKELTSSRGWEYAYLKELEREIEILRDSLETNSDFDAYRHLCGQIHGIRVAIKDLTEIRERYSADDDVDLRG